MRKSGMIVQVSRPGKGGEPASCRHCRIGAVGFLCLHGKEMGREGKAVPWVGSYSSRCGSDSPDLEILDFVRGIWYQEMGRWNLSKRQM